MAQHDELAILGPELVDGAFERKRQLGVFEVPEGVFGEILDHELDLAAVAVGAIQRHGLEPAPAQVVDPEVVTDAEQPRREAVLRVEPFERRPRTDERLLAEFASELDVSDELTEKGRQSPLIAAHEDGEGIFIPIEGEPHKLFVRGLFKAHSVVMIQGFAAAERSVSWCPRADHSDENRVDSTRRWIVKKKWFATIVVLCLGTCAGFAQSEDAVDPSAQGAVGGLPFAGEVDVTVVNVNVYVTDKEGFSVTDLNADDFTLTQDGTAKQITNFGLFTDEIYRSFYRDQGPPTALPTPTPIPGSESLSKDSFRPVYVVLYFDNENSRSIDRNRLVTQLRGFVRENLRPPVQMMVIAYHKSYEVLQTFTDDQRGIYDALREIKIMSGGRNQLDSARKDILRLIGESQRSSQRDVGSMSRAHGQVVGFAEEEANSLQFTLGALRDTVTMLSGLPGKKIIVYISNGLPMVAGLDLFYAYSNTYQESSAITESARYNQARQFTSLVSNANAQDISFCTFGVGGLENPTIASAELGTQQDTMSASLGMQNYLDSLRFMAENTGGIAVVNTNDFTLGLERISQDFFTYYSLGYTLHQSGLDKVHKIEVEIPDHPEYRVRYRRRFVEKSLESRVQDKVVTGLMFPLDDNSMQIMVEIGSQGPAGETRWMVPLELSVPLRKVALLPAGDEYIGNVTMFLAARSTNGERSDVVRQNHEIRVKAADYEAAQIRRYTITANLLMEAGTHNVAVGLLDPVTRNASFTTTKVTVKE